MCFETHFFLLILLTRDENEAAYVNRIIFSVKMLIM